MCPVAVAGVGLSGLVLLEQSMLLLLQTPCVHICVLPLRSAKFYGPDLGVTRKDFPEKVMTHLN